MSKAFEFAFDPRYRFLLVPYGATPDNSGVTITDDGKLDVRFGWMHMRIPLSNVSGAELTGPYRWWKAIGVRMSVRDRGLTFGTTPGGGVCVRFHRPVRSALSAVGIRHPGLTVTVEDRVGLQRALTVSPQPRAGAP